MFKKTLKIIAVAFMLLVAYFALQIFWLASPTQTPEPHQDSTILMTRSFGSAASTVEITDPADIAFLRELFGKSYEAVLDTPSCPFGYVKISFVHDGKSIDFFPAADGCQFVCYGNHTLVSKKLFVISNQDSLRFERIWKTAP